MDNSMFTCESFNICVRLDTEKTKWKITVSLCLYQSSIFFCMARLPPKFVPETLFIFRFCTDHRVPRYVAEQKQWTGKVRRVKNLKQNNRSFSIHVAMFASIEIKFIKGELAFGLIIITIHSNRYHTCRVKYYIFWFGSEIIILDLSINSFCPCWCWKKNIFVS